MSCGQRSRTAVGAICHVVRETEIFVEDKDTENTENVSESIDKTSVPGVPREKESFKTRIEGSVSARFKNLPRYCVLHR